MRIAAFVLFFTLVNGSTGAEANTECKTDKGVDVNPNNGADTAKLTGVLTCKYDMGHTIKERYVKGKVIEEEWFYESGKRRSRRKIWHSPEGNERTDGKLEEWHENGQLKSMDNYNRGQKQGAFIRHFENGTIARQGVHKDDRELVDMTFNKDGSVASVQCSEDPAVAKLEPYNKWCGFTASEPVTFFYEKGKKKWVHRYQKGKLLSYEVYSMAGQLMETSSKATPNGAGVKIIRYPNGKIKSETRTDGDGYYHGAQREYDPSGTMTREGMMNKGFETWEKTFYLNGQPKSYTERKQNQDVVEIKTTQYFDNGKPASTSFYEKRGYDEKPVGVHKLYGKTPDDGWAAVTYTDGFRSRHQTYDKNGKLIEDEEFFRDGSSKKHSVKR